MQPVNEPINNDLGAAAPRSLNHVAVVVPVVMEKHPDADRLSIVRVEGFTCVVATDAWQGYDRGVYVQPDSLVSVDRPEFAFLKEAAGGKLIHRVRAKKLRGIRSFGLLVPVGADVPIGTDMTDALGIMHYEPTENNQEESIPILGADGKTKKVGIGGGDAAVPPPRLYAPKYDLRTGRARSRKLLTQGEPVYITEKLHGQNARYIFRDGVFHVGSRDGWKKEYPCEHLTRERLLEAGVKPEDVESLFERLYKKRSRTSWWNVDCLNEIRSFCESHPNYLLYGEAYGSQVQRGFTYGKPQGTFGFAAFDISVDGVFLNTVDAYELCEKAGVPFVPFLRNDNSSSRSPTLSDFSFDNVCDLAEGKSCIDGTTIREGVVVVPQEERMVGEERAKLKWVGTTYYERG